MSVLAFCLARHQRFVWLGEAHVDGQKAGRYNHELLIPQRFSRKIKVPGVFARLVPALVFKTSRRIA